MNKFDSLGGANWTVHFPPSLVGRGSDQSIITPFLERKLEAWRGVILSDFGRVVRNPNSSWSKLSTCFFRGFDLDGEGEREDKRERRSAWNVVER